MTKKKEPRPTCHWCEAPFVPRKSWQVYCGKPCRLHMTNARRGRLGLTARPCGGCHREFMPSAPGGRYCSDACRGRAATAASRRYRAKQRGA